MKTNHATKNGSAAERLAEKLGEANRWRKAAPGTNPASSCNAAVIVAGEWDRVRHYIAIGRYNFGSDSWSLVLDDNVLPDVSGYIVGWYPLPKVPSNLLPIPVVEETQ